MRPEYQKILNNHLQYIIENAAERSVCCSIGGMQLIYSNFFDLYEKILNTPGRGGYFPNLFILEYKMDNHYHRER